MPHHVFLLLLDENIGLYLISLVLSAIPIYFIAKNYSHSWVDPLRISLIFVALANAVLLFLFFLNEIPEYLFYYSAAAIVLFWVGFLIPAKRKISFSNRKFCEDDLIIKLLFYEVLILYISSYLYSYAAFGIPIFAESRIGTFIDSGGFGAIARITPFFQVFILMYCYRQFDGKISLGNKYIYFITFLLIVITSILSGSRSSLVTFFSCYFGYSYYYLGIKPRDKKLVKYFPVILVGTITVLLITNDGDIVNALSALFVRIVATGDGYYMAYPNEIVNLVDAGNSAMFLLSQILAPLRIIDVTTIPPPVGVQLSNILYPEMKGLFVGPNSSPPILGFVLFGYMGLIFTFVVGLLSSILIFRSSSIIPRSFVSSVVLFFIYMVAVRFMADPSYGIGSLFDVALNLFVLLNLILISYIIKSVLIRLPQSFSLKASTFVNNKI